MEDNRSEQRKKDDKAGLCGCIVLAVLGAGGLGTSYYFDVYLKQKKQEEEAESTENYSNHLYVNKNTIIRTEDVNKDGIEDRVMLRAEPDNDGVYRSSREEVLFGVRTLDGRIMYIPKESLGEYAEKPSQK